MPLSRLLPCLCLASLSTVFAGTVPPPAKASAAVPLHITYKVEEKPAKCPSGRHPQGGCVWLTGQALASGVHWPDMRRLAIVDAPAPSLPAGCDTATTRGVLSGTDGIIHFTAAGYYCPKTDTAWYRYTFNATDAKRFSLPLHGSIRYVGSSNTEAFASSTQ